MSSEPILTFDDQSPEFVHGFEAGQIWERMENGCDIARPLHIENIELIQRMGSKMNYTTHIEPRDETWCWLQAWKGSK